MSKNKKMKPPRPTMPSVGKQMPSVDVVDLSLTLIDETDEGDLRFEYSGLSVGAFFFLRGKLKVRPSDFATDKFVLSPSLLDRKEKRIPLVAKTLFATTLTGWQALYQTLLQDGVDKDEARDCANYMLPLAAATRGFIVTDKKTIEAVCPKLVEGNDAELRRLAEKLLELIEKG